jgi:hypothetical protein
MHGDEVRGSKPSFSFSEAEFFLVDLNSVAEPFQKPLQPLRVGGRHRKHGVAGEVIFFFSVAAWSPTVPNSTIVSSRRARNLSALDRRNPRLLQLQHERKRHCSCRVLVTEAIRQGSEVVEYDQLDPRSNAVLDALVPQCLSRPLQWPPDAGTEFSREMAARTA